MKLNKPSTNARDKIREAMETISNEPLIEIRHASNHNKSYRGQQPFGQKGPRSVVRLWQAIKAKTTPPLYTLLLFTLGTTPQAGTLKVGPQHPIKLPSQAAALAQDGDTVEIEAGPYLKDATIWRADNLIIKGINGKAQLLSQGKTVEGKAIWVIKGNTTTVENIEFADARVPEKNGAGIRLEGTNLTVRNCLFKNNEMGILTGVNLNSTVSIDNSVFEQNGQGDGIQHNIYIGNIARFNLTNSVSCRAKTGHQVKSRAAFNHIENNLLEDGPTGRSSYLIDLPAGGVGHIIGNMLHQGPNAENFTMLAYGAEKMLHTQNSVTISHNTFKNDRKTGCRLIWIKPHNVTATLKKNQYIGCSRIDGNYTE